MSLKAFTLDAFRDLAAKNQAPAEDVIIRVPMASEVKADEGDSKLVTFTITTDAPDRDRDVIAIDGWDLKAYKKNPVVLWAHDYRQLPVARAKSIKVDGNKISAVADFTESAALDEFAAKVHAFVRAGLLNATSVGFRPLKYAYNEQRGGVDFQAAELLEFSVVPIPANPQALVEQRSAGQLDTVLIDRWAEGWLKASRGEGLWVPTKTISIPSMVVESAEKQITDILARLVKGIEREVAYAEQKLEHAKGKPECPAGTGCANMDNRERCPSDSCPMQSAARADATIPNAKDHVLMLDDEVLPKNSNELSDDEVKAAITELLAEASREAVMRLTGRVD